MPINTWEVINYSYKSLLIFIDDTGKKGTFK